MSTRATYEIDGTTFYCHWDGYPAGAAYRFAKMVEALNVPERSDRRTITAIEDRRGGATFAFIRGVIDAEPTDSHSAHGDTEHRYRVTTGKGAGELMIEHASRYPGERWGAWRAPEPLADFINREGPAWEGEELCPPVVAMRDPCPHWQRTILATLENAKALRAAELELEQRYQDGNPNKGRHAEQAKAWSDAIAALDLAGLIARLARRKATMELESQKADSEHIRKLHAARAERCGQRIDELLAVLEPAPSSSSPATVAGQRPGETAIDAQNRRAREIMTPPGVRLD
jgi:hypothetical protein